MTNTNMLTYIAEVDAVILESVSVVVLRKSVRSSVISLKGKQETMIRWLLPTIYGSTVKCFSKSIKKQIGIIIQN